MSGHDGRTRFAFARHAASPYQTACRSRSTVRQPAAYGASPSCCAASAAANRLALGSQFHCESTA